MKTEIVSVREEGTVREVKKSIVKVEGLSNCMNGQLVDFADRTKGMVMGFNEKEVLVLLLGTGRKVKAGDKVYSKHESFKIPAGEGFVGRVVNALAEPVDGKGPIMSNGPQNLQYPVFADAPAVLDRIPIDEALETGIRVVDSCVPIGKGQRELIIGDRMTGKTTLCVDTILNQKEKNVVCIYCGIGRDYSSLKKVISLFKEKQALDYTIIVLAPAADFTGQQYLVPYTAAALGEYFMYSGRDVLIVFDDLTKHAWAYRELSLLLERPPGREAYPGDIFYLHSQLMERAGKLKKELGGGSMTFFPVADTLQGDVAGFIPTNLISMTDGQIYLNTALFSEGFKPAIDLSLSVSRIGNKVQSPAMRELTQTLKLEYVRYIELLKTTKLKPGISDETAARLKHGEKVQQVFIQEKNCFSPPEEQMLLFYALQQGVLDVLSPYEHEDFKRNIFDFTGQRFPMVIEKLKQHELTEDDKRGLDECLKAFFKES